MKFTMLMTWMRWTMLKCVDGVGNVDGVDIIDNVDDINVIDNTDDVGNNKNLAIL